MLRLSLAELLMGVIVLQQGLAALMWWLSARVQVVPRVPALHWAAGALWAAGVVGCTVLGQNLGPAFSHSFTNMMAPGVFILLRLGLQILLRAPRQDGEHALVAVLAVASAWGGHLAGAPLFWGIATASLLNAYCLLRLAQTVRLPVRQELGEGAVRLVTWPLRALAGVFLLRALLALVVPPEAVQPLYVDTPPNIVVLVIMMTLGLVMHLVLALCVALRLVRRLHRLSRQDALTLLPNRRAADEHLARLFARLRAGQGGFALALADVDHFKRVNDQQGHAIGDRALAHLAAQLRAQARPVDLVARFGGEEFVLLLPDVDAATAHAVAERQCQAAAAEPLRLGATALPLSISLGVGVARADDSAESLLARVDAALYRAKAAGRNRVELAA
ncbi:diguanylate cyclase [Inhella sp.]|uniref:GGDEF domain-containing protein n=1 Tax=Inhella sp. TaxID=1921806 RepID=UPI0035ADC466